MNAAFIGLPGTYDNSYRYLKIQLVLILFSISSNIWQSFKLSTILGQSYCYEAENRVETYLSISYRYLFAKLSYERVGHAH